MPLVATKQTLSRSDAKLFDTWEKRREAAEKDRRRYEPAWLTAQQFAAGRQWAAYLPREHRMIVPPLPKGRSRHTADRLTQYVMTVVGQLAADDFRGHLVPARDDAQADDYQKTLDDLLAYGWDREWDGDERALKLIRTLAWMGTGGIRVRFDPDKGKQIADVPHRDGSPILDPDEARTFVSEAHFFGEDAGIRNVREGRIVWDVLTPWNLLPPPGVEEPDEFPWELIVRPVHVDVVSDRYGVDVQAEDVQAMDVLGLANASVADDQSPMGQGRGSLEEHALVYTGYDLLRHRTVVFTRERLLEVSDSLPLEETSGRPARSGITYFWYWRIPGRFWGRGLAEPGFGPQRTINKRVTQMDEIIDRGLPKVYVDKGGISKMPEGRVLEVMEMKPGSNRPVIEPGIGPAGWFKDDLAIQDSNIEKALGVRAVSLGENPVGVQTYGQLALLRESDANKIDPIAADLRLHMTRTTYDSVELMRLWPKSKQLAIVGEDDTLELRAWQDFQLPSEYMVRPTKGGTQLRTTAAELQKIRDIWEAALASGRQDMLDWYVESLNAGKAQDLPANPARAEQHIAALENILLARGENVPVAPTHNHELHLASHIQEREEWQQLAVSGDQEAQAALAAFEQHILGHQSLMQPAAAPGLVATPGNGLSAGPPQPPAQPPPPLDLAA